MITKKQTIFQRTVNKGKSDEHRHRVIKSTWWLFCFIPLYSSEEIMGHNL